MPMALRPLHAVRYTCLALVCLSVTSCDPRPSADTRMCNALLTGDTNYIRRFLTLGGDVNQTVQYTQSRREYAPLLDLALGAGQLATVDFLLRNQANPNQRDSAGDTPLRWAIGRVRGSVPLEARLRAFEMLLETGADPNLSVSKEAGHTPLLEAALLGQTDMVRVLLAAGIDVKSTNASGQSGLHLAGNPEVARILIAAGADRSARTLSGASPADTAARLGHLDVLAVLTNRNE